jgi:hypothetical protein
MIAFTVAFVTTTVLAQTLLPLLTGCDADDGLGLLVQASGGEVPERGSLLLMQCEDSQQAPLAVGDTVVLKLHSDRELLLFRKIVTVRADALPLTSSEMLTKGTSNSYDDRGLYPGRLESIRSDSSMHRGKIVAHFPLVGIIVLLQRDYPIVGFALCLCLLWFAIRNDGVSIKPTVALAACATLAMNAKLALGSF